MEASVTIASFHRPSQIIRPTATATVSAVRQRPATQPNTTNAPPTTNHGELASSSSSGFRMLYVTKSLSPWVMNVRLLWAQSETVSPKVAIAAPRSGQFSGGVAAHR